MGKNAAHHPQKSVEAWALALVLILYLGVIFPLCFFRHDDWWILGNSVLKLPNDWAFLWRPTLFHGTTEIDWFFRPFFKLFCFLFFKTFAFEYYAWLLTLFVIFAATLGIGYRALKSFSGTVAATAFLVFFLGALPLHLGSLAWVGEGLMNIPQAFLLMAMTAFFLRLADRPKFRLLDPALGGAWACFVLALGFKESTVFHLALLGGMVLSEPQFAFRKRYKMWCLYFLPLAVTAAVYLAIRLGWMPINQGYRQEFEWQQWSLTFLKFWSIPVLASLLWIATDARLISRRWKAWGKALCRRIYWIPYFAVSSFIYLGLSFFSPGWWYLPALFLAVGIALCQQEVSAQASREESLSFAPRWQFACSLVVFAAISGWQLQSIGWWKWGSLQRQVHRAILATDSRKITDYAFYLCASKEYPDVSMSRVIGDAEALKNHWAIVHETSLNITYRACGNLARDLRFGTAAEGPNEAVFAWQFPELLAVGPNASNLLIQSARR